MNGTAECAAAIDAAKSRMERKRVFIFKQPFCSTFGLLHPSTTMLQCQGLCIETAKVGLLESKQGRRALADIESKWLWSPPKSREPLRPQPEQGETPNHQSIAWRTFLQSRLPVNRPNATVNPSYALPVFRSRNTRRECTTRRRMGRNTS